MNACFAVVDFCPGRFYNMSGGVSNLSSAVDSLNQRIQYEERKLDAVRTLNRRTTTFLSNAVTTDAQVARMVAASQEKFFQQYEWLRPAVAEEKSWWEQKLDGWNQFWQGAGEAFRNLADKVGGFLSGAVDVVKDTVKEVFSTVVTFAKEHLVELLVGATAIVAGAVLLAISGGTAAAFGVAFLAGLKAAAISAVMDGAINAAVAWVTGGDVGKAFGDGLASGFMMGGIFFAANISFGKENGLSLEKRTD